MAKSLNKVTLIGNVGKDPELRFTPNNRPVASIPLATSDSWKDNTGKQMERTEWHNLVLWDRLAEIVRDYVKKGAKIYVEGRLQSRSWEDQNGLKRYTTEVIVRDLILLSGRDSMSGGGSGSQQMSNSGNAGSVSESAYPDDEYANNDDDLPF